MTEIPTRDLFPGSLEMMILQTLRRGIGPAAGEESWDSYVELVVRLAGA